MINILRIILEILGVIFILYIVSCIFEGRRKDWDEDDPN